MVTPIGSLYFRGKEHTVADGGEGPVTKKLRETLCSIHTGGSGLHPEWITTVPQFEVV